MSKIAVFFATGFEEIEALTVVDLLRRTGLDVDMVSITGEKYVTSSHNITVAMDKLLEEVDFSAIDMLVLPGGMPGTKNLEACEAVMQQVDEFYAQKKDISAICAAPSILGHRGYLQGRKACCFPEYESHLTGALVTSHDVEISDHIITARGMGCAIPFGLAIVERFQGKEAADELQKKIIYQHSILK